MQLALKNNERVSATPSAKATCPLCRAAVSAKCGAIKIWHWAHDSLIDCDSWGEPESVWHIRWKEEFPEKCREVVLPPHRADIKSRGMVIELQHSSISLPDVLKREQFYKNMVWLIDVGSRTENFHFREKVSDNGTDYWSFKWKWCPAVWRGSNKVIYLDFGNAKIFQVWKLYERGWGAGVWINKEDFIKRFA